jgi:hypothetical protein
VLAAKAALMASWSRAGWLGLVAEFVALAVVVVQVLFVFMGLGLFKGSASW